MCIIKTADSGDERLGDNILRSPRYNLRLDGLKILTKTGSTSVARHGLRRANTINIQDDGVCGAINNVNIVDQN